MEPGSLVGSMDKQMGIYDRADAFAKSIGLLGFHKGASVLIHTNTGEVMVGTLSQLTETELNILSKTGLVEVIKLDHIKTAEYIW